MARGADTYSSVIAWLKILLPMVALIMLSTLFLFPRGSEPLSDMPFADPETATVPTGEQVTAPYYAGTTSRGEALTMTARSARPVDEGSDSDLSAEDLSARMDMGDGSVITLKSRTALLSDSSREALLQGGVVIESSTGYVLNTESMRTAIDRIEAESMAPVSGTGPAGTLQAGRMKIVPLGEGNDVQLLFTDGVKLVYDPKKQ
ncbi:LPS export ABC transporter periplasmic protein LptC [Salipiger sp.]|uniref:LPS export ABC transporter periplasmic protein LptC n=1 Tax=Salipiger sp. TaxID=2078585 RepID=UPI003A96CB18